MNKSVAPHPFNSGNLGAPEVDSWLFPVRGLAQRRLAFDWNRSCGANENAAGTGDPFFREAVSAHRPVFLEPVAPPSPAPLPSNVLEDGFRAKRTLADTRAYATHPF